MSVKYEGIIPPIVTPFTASGEIDEEKIRREMEICLDAGADGISVGGSTGEGPTFKFVQSSFSVGNFVPGCNFSSLIKSLIRSSTW